MTRQHRWRVQRIANGECAQCGEHREQVAKTLCNGCLALDRKRQAARKSKQRA